MASIQLVFVTLSLIVSIVSLILIYRFLLTIDLNMGQQDILRTWTFLGHFCVQFQLIRRRIRNLHISCIIYFRKLSLRRGSDRSFRDDPVDDRCNNQSIHNVNRNEVDVCHHIDDTECLQSKIKITNS